MSSLSVTSPSSSSSFSTPLWSSDDIKLATKGEGERSFSANTVVVDSRQIKGDELFVALKGPQFDGHDYVAQALEKGAAGALVDHIPEGLSKDSPLIIVPDVLKALNDLAAFARERSTAKIIGITGSFGKTSLKEALRYLLENQAPTLATERSFNNHWGLPLTLARLHPDHKYALIEMGMNSLGEISGYSKLVKPHIALITNTGDAHIGKLGTLHDIEKAKAEIFDGMEKGGAAILWAQDDAFDFHKKIAKNSELSVISFGKDADFKAEYDLTKTGLNITISNEISFSLATFATHWADNCAALSACLKSLGGSLNWQEILTSMEAFSFPQGRGNIVTSPSGIVILDESYNAAPTTMTLALDALVAMGTKANGRIIALLGDMLELGDKAKAYHTDLASSIPLNKIHKVYCCGDLMKSLYKALPSDQKKAWAKDPQDLMEELLFEARPNDIYLVKGSRGQWAERGRMSVFVDALSTLELQQTNGGK